MAMIKFTASLDDWRNWEMKIGDGEPTSLSMDDAIAAASQLREAGWSMRQIPSGCGYICEIA